MLHYNKLNMTTYLFHCTLTPSLISRIYLKTEFPESKSKNVLCFTETLKLQEKLFISNHKQNYKIVTYETIDTNRYRLPKSLIDYPKLHRLHKERNFVSVKSNYF